MTRKPAPSSRFARWLAARPDDAVLRWVFSAAIAAAACVLVLDFMELEGLLPDDAWGIPGLTAPATLAPALREGHGDPANAPPLTSRRAGKMSFDLVEGGRLLAVGAIEPGAAEAFKAEVNKRGSYIKTVVLESPGGSVSDALAMGRLIRQKGFATEVEAGRTCASSCPLVFASGVERRAGAKAAIGVHQVSAWSEKGAERFGGMDSAQRVSAECQRYLREMGIDLEVWVRAMETPKEKLYFFKPAELLALKLATQSGGAKPGGGEARAPS